MAQQGQGGPGSRGPQRRQRRRTLEQLEDAAGNVLGNLNAPLNLVRLAIRANDLRAELERVLLDFEQLRFPAGRES